MSKSLNPKREKEIKDFENSGSSYSHNEDYQACKTKLDQIYDKKVEGLKIRNKCDWYEKGEKSTEFVVTL